MKEVKVKSYLRGHNFSFEKKGNNYDLTLGNWSDAGWRWDGKKSELAGYLVRVANSTEKDKFIQEVIDEKIEFVASGIKNDAVNSIIRHNSGIYEVSGDNNIWQFGNWDSVLESDEEFNQKSLDYFEYSYERFVKSYYGKETKKELIKIFQNAPSFNFLFNALTTEGTKLMFAELFSDYYDQELLTAEKKFKKMNK